VSAQLYDRGGRQERTDQTSGAAPSGELAEICLRPGEHLTGVEGHCGEFEGGFVLCALTLVSDRPAAGSSASTRAPAATSTPSAPGSNGKKTEQ